MCHSVLPVCMTSALCSLPRVLSEQAVSCVFIMHSTDFPQHIPVPVPVPDCVHINADVVSGCVLYPASKAMYLDSAATGRFQSIVTYQNLMIMQHTSLFHFTTGIQLVLVTGFAIWKSEHFAKFVIFCVFIHKYKTLGIMTYSCLLLRCRRCYQ
jgi:hypothetical protein